MRSLSLTLSALVVFLCLLSLTDVKAEVADRIVAVVNDDIITLSELNEEGSPYFQALIKQVPVEHQQSEMQKLKQEVLSHLIDQRLVEQQAAKLEIKVADEEINQTIDTMLTENRVTRDDFLKELASKGITETQYRQQMKGQILQSRLVNVEIRSKVVITEEKINQYYQENYGAGGAASSGSGYHILQIGFLWGEEYKQKSAAEAKLAAENARKQLDEGRSFKDVAIDLSDLPSKVDGGDIGVFQQNELAPFMKEAVLALKPGEISNVIETPNGYQLLKLISAPESSPVDTKAKATPPPEVRKEIETKLFREESEKLFKKWITELRTTAFIKENL